jgi:hypothetical protein
MRYELTIEDRALAARSMTDLNDAELEQWMWACLRMWQCASRVSLQRWRWRGRWRRASRLLNDRTRARMGTGPALCERCARVPPTVHITYGKHKDERYGHFCSPCARLEPTGRLVVRVVN